MSYKKQNDIRVDLKRLHPWLQYKIKLWLKKCNKNGIYVIITEGYRTQGYQDSLYAKGRTAPGKIVTYAKGSDMNSQHQWGVAFDFAIVDDINTKKKEDVYDLTTMKKVAKYAKSVGLAWGGDWQGLVDTPHLYLKKWGDTPAMLKKIYGTFTNFKKTWTAKVRGTKKGLNIWNKTHTKVIFRKVPNGKAVNVMYVKLLRVKVEYKGKVCWMSKKYLGL